MTENKNAKKRNTKGIALRLGTYVIRQWHLFIPAVILTFVSNHLALLGPKYSGAAIDAVTLETGVDFPVVWDNVIKMIICFAGAALLSYLLSIIMVFLSVLCQ